MLSSFWEGWFHPDGVKTFAKQNPPRLRKFVKINFGQWPIKKCYYNFITIIFKRPPPTSPPPPPQDGLIYAEVGSEGGRTGNHLSSRGPNKFWVSINSKNVYDLPARSNGTQEYLKHWKIFKGVVRSKISREYGLHTNVLNWRCIPMGGGGGRTGF